MNQYSRLLELGGFYGWRQDFEVKREKRSSPGPGFESSNFGGGFKSASLGSGFESTSLGRGFKSSIFNPYGLLSRRSQKFN
jgi:hypothetical protein